MKQDTPPKTTTTPSPSSITRMNEDDQREHNLHCYGIYATDAELLAIMEDKV